MAELRKRGRDSLRKNCLMLLLLREENLGNRRLLRDKILLEAAKLLMLELRVFDQGLQLCLHCFDLLDDLVPRGRRDLEANVRGLAVSQLSEDALLLRLPGFDQELDRRVVESRQARNQLLHGSQSGREGLALGVAASLAGAPCGWNCCGARAGRCRRCPCNCGGRLRLGQELHDGPVDAL